MTEMTELPFSSRTGAPRLRSYQTTDMAAELYRTAEAKRTGSPAIHGDIPGMQYTVRRENGIETEILAVETEEASALLGKSIGSYYTVHTGEVRMLGVESYDACRRSIRAALSEAIRTVLPAYRIPPDAPAPGHSDAEEPAFSDAQGEEAAARHAVSPEWDRGGYLHDAHHSIDDTGVTCITHIPPEPVPEAEPYDIHSVLAVGLGNPELTADAFGTLCVRGLNVTRHLIGEDSPLPAPLASSLHALSAFCPMVLGQTGIETLSLVRGAVDAVQPDLVILLDALAASDPASLGKTVQISTTGIHPGSGVGNRRSPLVAETLGVPVLTVGVPTVISAAALISRTLEDAGLLPDENAEDTAPVTPYLRKALDGCRGSFVTPKDADLTVREYARLTACVINETVLGEATAAEWFRRI